MDLSGNDLGLPGMKLLCEGLQHPKCRLQMIQWVLICAISPSKLLVSWAWNSRWLPSLYLEIKAALQLVTHNSALDSALQRTSFWPPLTSPFPHGEESPGLPAHQAPTLILGSQNLWAPHANTFSLHSPLLQCHCARKTTEFPSCVSPLPLTQFASDTSGHQMCVWFPHTKPFSETPSWCPTT